jgi:hypothetical protein
VAGRFADGAWLAELAAVRDPAQVAAVVAAALGIREQPGMAAADTLARVLAGQQLLLVLDNCEHVIEAAAQLCAGLLAACDDVRVLATSREPLAVAGETRYRLGPLTLPSPGDPADGGRSEAEAVALFADRARRVDAGFVLDGENGPVVARLVTRLDGMPLAIELAAARVEALGVAGLLDRIGDRFALLTGGDRLAAGRQRSLSATVEWSYRLLEEHERRVFRMVSVFPAGFTLEGAEAVAGPGAGAVVLRLVDHRQQSDREHRQPDLPSRERRTARHSEQERGEGRVDERQLRRPEIQRVEHRRPVPHSDAGIPVDGRVDLLPVVLRGRVDEQGITGHGQQEQCDGGDEPGGWPYSSHRSVSSALNRPDHVR